MIEDLADRLSLELGNTVKRIRPLSGGCIADVFELTMADGGKLVAKVGDDRSGLDLEGRMIRYLRDIGNLPVPSVIVAEPNLLVMSHMDNRGGLDPDAERTAARAIAALHRVTGPYFGFGEDTMIGGLPQKNPETASWIDFYRDHRLFFMGDEAHRAGRLPTRVRSRLDVFGERLPALIEEPPAPQLLHGDLWGGNVLVGRNGEVGFIDPAIYYGHGEMDLAFSTLFNSFGRAFFDAYRGINSIPPGFFEERRDIYNLYPLLVHVRLFGNSYVGSVEGILAKFGC